MGKSDMRVTYMRRHSYATKSNKCSPVKTPGGRLKLHRLKKITSGPVCGDFGGRLHGIKKLSIKGYKNCKKRNKSVSRAYGGTLCGKAVRDR